MMKIKRSIILLLALALIGAMLCACDEEISYLLTPEKADFSYAHNVIIESTDGLSNLGGWKKADEVKFEFELKKAGNYSVTLYYSRPASEGSDVDISVSNTGYGIIETLPITGESWSDYKVVTLDDTLYFSSTDATLYIRSDYPQDIEHVINLRSIKLTFVSK